MSDDGLTEEHDGTSSSEGNDDSESEEEMQVESLIAGRAKRATAGNRLAALINKEEADDELTLLFEEEEGGVDDVEFEINDGEDASDVELESSSDDDDQGPAAGDDLEGEKELAKQLRVEKRKKRKAQELFKKPAVSRKKVKIDPTNTATRGSVPAAKPKKSERVTWLPTSEAGPVRASSRKQTVQNKEVVHQRMQENEKRRRQQIQIMEKAAKRKDAAKPKVLTQADRLAEAARIEKTNAKSLNKWEETEKKRAEEQKARLAAMHNRQIKGPYIRWWSGPSKWVNGMLVTVGVEGKDKEENPKTAHKAKNSPSKATSTDTRSNVAGHDTTRHDVPPSQLNVPPGGSGSTASGLPSQVYSAPPQPGPAFLDRIQYYAPMPEHLQYNTMQQYRPPPPPAPVTEYMTRNLVIVVNVDADAQKTPELQDHVLLSSKKAPKATAKALSKLAFVFTCGYRVTNFYDQNLKSSTVLYSIHIILLGTEIPRLGYPTRMSTPTKRFRNLLARTLLDGTQSMRSTRGLLTLRLTVFLKASLDNRGHEVKIAM